MNIESIVRELESNYSGNPWHGSALKTIVAGVDESRAFAHPIPNARSIAELLAHTIAWNEIVARRAGGEAPAVSPEMDFPPVHGVQWRDLLKRLDTAHTTLTDAVSGLTDLQAIVPGKKHSFYVELHGLMHHNTYHAAQIAMLKK